MQTPRMQVQPLGHSGVAAQSWAPPQLEAGKHDAVVLPPWADRQQMSPPWQFAVPRQSTDTPWHCPLAMQLGPVPVPV
jgi:hypothetical protein